MLPKPVRDAVWRTAVHRRPRPRWGNLRRTEPLSRDWGIKRGLPADRYYVEQFLAAHAADVRGRALEVHGSQYVDRYGAGKLDSVSVLDVDADNPAATIVGDLAVEATLPEGGFDCFVLTQTIQFIRDCDAAVANAYRCLAPGGVLLLTVPTTSRLEEGYPDYWRWTPAGLEALLDRTLPAESERTVEGFGNVLTAVAFLYGLAAEELTTDEYAVRDPFYPMIACARIRKPG